MIQLRKLNFVLITGAAIMLAGNLALAQSPQKNNKPSENDESQSLSAPPFPAAESPHGISERSNANKADQSSSVPSGSSNKNATSDEKEKNTSSSGNNPKQ